MIALHLSATRVEGITVVQETLFELSKLGVTDSEIASEMGVSLSTVNRWRNGRSQPQPAYEGKLRRLASSTASDEARRAELFEAAVDRCLREVREALHRHSKLSSRNEALDVIAELFQGHVAALRANNSGITNAAFASSDPAQGLFDFLQIYGNPGSNLTMSLFSGGPAPQKWKEADQRLAIEIIDAFDRMSVSTPLIANIADGGDLLNLVFGRFLADSFQDEKELGQYLTPTEVVQFMVSLANLEFSDSERAALSDPSRFREFGYVLDPSCGVGSFLAEFVRAIHPKVAPDSPEWSTRAAEELIVGADKSERMLRLAQANLALFGSANPTLIQGNSLARFGDESKQLASLNGKVGLILTNPPFGATFNSTTLAGYRLAGEWRSRDYASIDSELLFLERYLDWLRPGGQLLAVVPDSILTNKGVFEDLRRGLNEHVDLVTIVSLPPVTFAAAGTATKTSILHLRKSSGGSNGTRFAICNSVGYKVSSRGAQRRKIFDGTNELPHILTELETGKFNTRVRHLADFDGSGRWDATYNASLPPQIEHELETNQSLVRLGTVAELSKVRVDPRKFESETFPYIEISDVDGDTLSVSAKQTASAEAPSRARTLVKKGDILISTVRPERKTLGVVPSNLDGAVCSTGFAVLRAEGITPLALAALLRTDFVTYQLLRNNVGIAYPAIESKILTELILPVDHEALVSLNEAALRYQEARANFENETDSFFQKVHNAAALVREDPKSRKDH